MKNSKQAGGRMQRSMNNTLASTVNFIFLLPTQFILRYFIAQYFGVDYMGINGLYTSILSVLSLVDLGVGASISYALYQPLANRNKKLVNALMNLYQRIYHWCAAGIIGLGLLLLPFLQMIIGKPFDDANIYLIFLLMLFNMAATYLFAYSQSLLIADQRNAVISWSGLIAGVVMLIGQIVAIIVTQSIYLYIVVALVGSLIYNFLLSRYTKHYYRMKKSKDKIPRQVIDKLIGNTIGNGLGRFSGVVVSGSDSILISIFVGLTAVGKYSNYLLITNVLQRFLMQLFNSVQASIGNFGATNKKSAGSWLYQRLQFINFGLVAVMAGGIVSTINPLITWWLGASYTLPLSNVILISIAFYVVNYQAVTLNFVAAYGLANKMKWIPIGEAAANIIFGLVALGIFKMGINGVLVGTILSTLMTVGWQKPYLVFRFGFQQSLSIFAKQYIKDGIAMALIVIFNLGIVRFGAGQWQLSEVTSIFASAILSITISAAVICCMYWHDDKLTYLFSLIR